MPRRKPAWLGLLCPKGPNPARLAARKCPDCREWVAVKTGRVETAYDPWVADMGELAAAIILRRDIVRIMPIGPTSLFSLCTVWGPDLIGPDGQYLVGHICGRPPIGTHPYKPPPMERTGKEEW